MGEHDNEELARRFYEEFWTRGNADAADDLIAEDFVHEQFPEGWPPGREGFKHLVRTWRAAFPDMHRRDFYGIPATNRTVEARGIDLLRFSDGLIAEWIYCEDTLGVFAQLGALPALLSDVAGSDHAG